jgi:hypothetical protein
MSLVFLKAENTLAVAGIYPYKPNTVSVEDFEPSQTTRRDKIPG